MSRAGRPHKSTLRQDLNTLEGVFAVEALMVAESPTILFGIGMPDGRPNGSTSRAARADVFHAVLSVAKAHTWNIVEKAGHGCISASQLNKVQPWSASKSAHSRERLRASRSSDLPFVRPQSTHEKLFAAEACCAQQLCLCSETAEHP